MYRKPSSYILLILVAIALVLTLNGLSVRAQDGTSSATFTPLPSPTGNGGNATWTVSKPTFKSNYPSGFTMSIQASSSAGKIKSANVYWRLSPTTQRNSISKYDEATDTWSGGWVSTPGDYLPAWVGVNWWFVFIDEAGNAFQSTSIYNEYEDSTGSWGRMESEDVIVFWERPIPDQIGQMTLDAVAGNRELYRSAFGQLLNYKPRAILYATKDSFQEFFNGRSVSIAGSNGGVVGGETDQVWGGTVQWDVHKDARELAYGTVLHEFGHLYQGMTRTLALKQWWVEGDATFFEVDKGYDYKDKARQLMNTGDYGSLQDEITGTYYFRAYYDIGYSFVQFLVDTYGIDAHLRVVENVQAGSTLFQAIEKAVGKPFPEIELEWRTWLGVDNPTVPTVQPTFVIKTMATPTFRSFGPKKTATATTAP